ncbi:MAG: hydroxyacylglutathione hydrolase [Paucibacter sp.]|nr:hydroxyacylglutathione hydrolase [Roseateles sp.]
MFLIALPAFADNYIWMLHDGQQALVVDPGDAEPVHAALARYSLSLAGILVTHHHSDHTGGVDVLRDELHGLVWGPAHEAMSEPCQRVEGGETIHTPLGDFEVLDVPGHTAGHVAYVHRPAGQAPILFCGDTLFSAGCGRLLGGTAAQLHDSLERLAALPPETRVCCAHEYTLSNLRFAAAVDPDNAEMRAHQAWAEAQRRQGLPTLPSTIGVERAINPFLRVGEPAVRAAVHANATTDPVGVFASLRQWKNEFR